MPLRPNSTPMPLRPNPMGTGPNALMFLLSRLFPLSPANNPSAPAEGGFAEVANPALGFGVQNPLLAAARKPMIGPPNPIASKAALEAFQPDQLSMLGNIARPVVNSVIQAISKPGLPMYVTKDTTPPASSPVAQGPVVENLPVQPGIDLGTNLGAGNRAMSKAEHDALAAMSRASITPDVVRALPVSQPPPAQKPPESQTEALLQKLNPKPSVMGTALAMGLSGLGNAIAASMAPRSQLAHFMGRGAAEPAETMHKTNVAAAQADQQNRSALALFGLKDTAAKASKEAEFKNNLARDAAKEKMRFEAAKALAALRGGDKMPNTESLARTLQVLTELGALEGNEAKQAGRGAANAFSLDMFKKLGGVPTVKERK